MGISKIEQDIVEIPEDKLAHREAQEQAFRLSQKQIALARIGLPFQSLEDDILGIFMIYMGTVLRVSTIYRALKEIYGREVNRQYLVKVLNKMAREGRIERGGHKRGMYWSKCEYVVGEGDADGPVSL